MKLTGSLMMKMKGSEIREKINTNYSNYFISRDR